MLSVEHTRENKCVLKHWGQSNGGVKFVPESGGHGSESSVPMGFSLDLGITRIEWSANQGDRAGV